MNTAWFMKYKLYVYVHVQNTQAASRCMYDAIYFDFNASARTVVRRSVRSIRANGNLGSRGEGRRHAGSHPCNQLPRVPFVGRGASPRRLDGDIFVFGLLVIMVPIERDGKTMRHGVVCTTYFSKDRLGIGYSVNITTPGFLAVSPKPVRLIATKTPAGVH